MTFESSQGVCQEQNPDVLAFILEVIHFKINLLHYFSLDGEKKNHHQSLHFLFTMPKLNFKKTHKNNFLNKYNQRDFPGGPEADSELNAGGPGSIPGQETRPHTPQLRVYMLQLKFLYATTKTQCSEIHKIFKKNHQIKANAKINKIQKFSYSVVSDSLRPHGLQHARSPCPSPTPGACSNSCPSSR